MVDTVYIDNLETGEMESHIVKFHLGFSKSEKYKLKVTDNLISAPFTRVVLGHKGEAIGTEDFTIQFKREKNTFFVTKISDSKNSNWKKSGDYWDRLD